MSRLLQTSLRLMQTQRTICTCELGHHRSESSSTPSTHTAFQWCHSTHTAVTYLHIWLNILLLPICKPVASLRKEASRTWFLTRKGLAAFPPAIPTILMNNPLPQVSKAKISIHLKLYNEDARFTSVRGSSTT